MREFIIMLKIRIWIFVNHEASVSYFIKLLGPIILGFLILLLILWLTDKKK